MKAIQIQLPASLDTLKLVDLPEPAAPGAGEIQSHPCQFIELP